jgi:phosphoserine phosphatase
MGINKERAAKSRELKNAKPNDEDAEAKSLKDARMDAEARFRKLLDRRNALNDEARQAREARDSINAERQRIYGEVQGWMDERKKVSDQIKVHKAARNEAQDRARKLLALKQEKRKGTTAGLGSKVRELEAQIKALEFKQQTTVLTGPKELELLDEIKVKLRELEQAKRIKGEQDQVFGEVKDIDVAIRDSFGKADEEHAKVVELSNQWQDLTSKLEPAFQNLGTLKAQADKKHQDFIDLRKRADEEHAKASELRGEVEAKRAAVDALYNERRAIVQEFRQQVRSLEDPNALDQSADQAVKMLLEKGRISL